MSGMRMIRLLEPFGDLVIAPAWAESPRRFASAAFSALITLPKQAGDRRKGAQAEITHAGRPSFRARSFSPSGSYPRRVTPPASAGGG